MKILTSNNYEIISTNDLTNVRFYTSIDPGSYVAPHWHDALEIILLQSGPLTFTIGEERIHVQPGQCIIANPNVIHSTMCMEENHAIVFQIPLSVLERYEPNIRHMEFFMPDLSEDPMVQTKVDVFKETLQKMQIMVDMAPEWAMLRFNSLLFDAMFQLLHNFSRPADGETTERRDKQLEKLKGVLEYTEAHYNEAISLDEVAEIAMFETKYFCRFFKNCMGTTFIQYQNQLKLAKVYKDLMNTDDPVADILERHGFTNYKKFRTMFREEFHATPTEVRKQRGTLYTTEIIL